LDTPKQHCRLFNVSVKLWEVQRDPSRYEELQSIKKIKTHPLFTQVDGGIEEWEVINDEPQ